MDNELFKKALEEFRKAEKLEDIIPILGNDDIQILLVAWPKIILKYNAVKDDPPEDTNERWQWLWRHVSWCEKDLIETTGIAESKFRRLLNQVKGNRLIYPDGTVSVHAAKYLSHIAIVATARLKVELAYAIEKSQKK